MSHVQNFYSELNFICDWIDDHHVNGEAGYCCVTLQTATSFLEDLDAEDVQSESFG